MDQQHSEFKNILVIHFGQLGDVVLGLPALRAIRRHFPDSRITAMSGTLTAAIIRLAGVADEQLAVDRVELRDGNRFRSVSKMLKLVGEVRRRRFDLVIDLHSLSETNLLGFLAGIPNRLYANRKGRSLGRLCNFRPKPPLEDRGNHAATRYMDVIEPLVGENTDPVLKLEPDSADVSEVQKILREQGVEGANLVGMFLGAGHPSRRWPIQKFAELASRIGERDGTHVLVFLGPEEIDLLPAVMSGFPSSAIILDKLQLLPLFAALTFLKVLVSNDTGPTHLAAATEASIVLITDKGAPTEFLPLTQRLTVVNSGQICDIGIDEVYEAVRSKLENDISPRSC